LSTLVLLLACLVPDSLTVNVLQVVSAAWPPPETAVALAE
jgi:hypothetical protein